jgi:23S rRNA (guanine2069-N7)-methyltransferase / 23S rRNA (guanine2445-N2)-methyltransferase
MTGGDLRLIAVTAFGLEAVAVRELHGLGYENAKAFGTGRVGFTGGLSDVQRANLWLRSAERVLIEVGRFPAGDFEALFEGVRALAWEDWIGPEARFPVAGRSVRSTLTSVPAVQRATKKAIVERLMERHGTQTLPETGPEYAVEVSLLHDEAALTIDTTGAGLNKRGYRQLVGEAQIRETMAAALVLLSFWRPERQLLDPFCGSGTIPIEAAMIARNIAPGLRRSFAFEDWAQTDGGGWAEIKAEAEAAIGPPLERPLIGTDIDAEALSLARHHAGRAGVEGDIHWQQRAFEDLRAKAEYGCMVTNPPWGARLGDRDELERLYASFPRVLKGLPTWSYFIITGFPGFERLVGQKADRRRKLYSASIETTYYQFHGPRPGDFAQAASQVYEEDAGPEAATVPMPVFGGTDAKADKQAEMFATILRKHARHLRKWPERGVSCFRLYERDFPEVPLAVDVYEGYLHIAEYDRPHERTPSQHEDWLELMVRTACETLDIARDRAFIKKRGRQRDRHVGGEGGGQYERVAEESKRVVVGEQGLRFEVNLSDYIDTGLFLDHRQTRAMVRERAKGVRFLNLFGYTGSFTVYAAAGGAVRTTTVDLSATYLDWCERNLLLNKFNGPEHELVQADAGAYLDSLPAEPAFDLAVVDPPTFSNSKRLEKVWDVQVEHTGLLERLAMRMVPGGLVYFSTNFRKFKPAFPESVEVREISSKTVSPDFRNKKIHRCWVLRVT